MSRAQALAVVDRILADTSGSGDPLAARERQRGFGVKSRSTAGIAVIGSGYWGKNLVRNFYNLGALRLICDKNESILAGFKNEYKDELASTYFTSVMRKVVAQKGISIEFEDDGIEHRQNDPDIIVHHYPFEGHPHLGEAIQIALGNSVFSGLLSVKIYEDTDLIVDIINEQLEEEVDLTSMEVLSLPFFRGKGAYLVGQFRAKTDLIPEGEISKNEIVDLSEKGKNSNYVWVILVLIVLILEGFTVTF